MHLYKKRERDREKAGISLSEEPNVQNEALEFEVTLKCTIKTLLNMHS